MRTATWLTHLEFDWESPVWRHWLEPGCLKLAATPRTRFDTNLGPAPVVIAEKEQALSAIVGGIGGAN